MMDFDRRSRFRLWGFCILLQYPPNHIALHQFTRLVEVVVRDRVRVDAQAVVDRGEQFARMDRVVERG